MRSHSISCFLIVLIILILVPHSLQLHSSQSWSILRIQNLLKYPSFLSSWNNHTDFCYLEPNKFVTIVCYEESITQLQITGNYTSPLPHDFSVNSLFTTLARLPSLKVLSLTNLGLWGPLPTKILRLSSLEMLDISSNYFYGPIPLELSYLKNIQTLILHHNMFSGQIPNWFSEFTLLSSLSLKNNTFSGLVPDSFKTMDSLRVLDLSFNSLWGLLPDFSNLTNLQVLDVEGNYLGPQFPILGKKLVTLVLRKNKFMGGIPSDISSYYLLKKLDVSLNRFVGPFMSSLLSLPSIEYLDISGNRLSGMLFKNMSCSDRLEHVDLSSNLLTGDLPMCLTLDKTKRVVLYSGNCLESKDGTQHPNSFCQNQALAVGILPHKKRKEFGHRVVVAVVVIVAVVSVLLLVGLLMFFVFRKENRKARVVKKPPRRLVEHASNGYPSKMLADARYISQTMKLGALGVAPYKSFSLEELEAATNNFDPSNFMGEGSHGQMYRGKLKDGSLVAIRCLKLKRNHSSQNFNRHIELISKLRYRHLVSALGHCFEYYLDDSTVSRLFLVFESVSNGSLRDNISYGNGGKKLMWSQRITAAIGVARGIQFLHAGIIPGLFANNLKITNVLLDQNLVAKISSYNLPVLAESMKNQVIGSSSSGSKVPSEKVKHGDKLDIYDFGVILLEIIAGESISSTDEIETLKEQLQTTTMEEVSGKRSIIDRTVIMSSCPESLRTVTEICIRCLSKEPSDRPSVEDVLWNLQFAVQVQDASRGDSHSSDASASRISSPAIERM